MLENETVAECTERLEANAQAHMTEKEKTHIARCANWRAKADAYAKYYLSLFRPETIHDNLLYTWSALQDYVQTLMDNESALSKFRLMMMENHMKGMAVSKLSKKMTVSYRGRARDTWTDTERQDYEIKEALSRKTPVGMSLDDMIREAMGDSMGKAALKQVNLQLDHDSKQRARMEELFEKYESRSPSTVSGSGVSRKFFSSSIPFDVHKTFSAMKAWKPAAPGGTDSDSAPAAGPETRNRGNIPLSTQFREIRKDLAKRGPKKCSQQLELFDLYSNYFLGTGDDPPELVLVHGGPGVGKTTARDAIARASTLAKRFNLKTAFNAINATEMLGHTTAHLISLDTQHHMVRLGGNTQAIQKDLKSEGYDESSIVFVERGVLHPGPVACGTALLPLSDDEHQLLRAIWGEPCDLYW